MDEVNDDKFSSIIADMAAVFREEKIQNLTQRAVDKAVCSIIIDAWTYPNQKIYVFYLQTVTGLYYLDMLTCVKDTGYNLAEMLFNWIKKLETMNLEVVAITSDGGSSCVSAVKLLNYQKT